VGQNILNRNGGKQTFRQYLIVGTVPAFLIASGERRRPLEAAARLHIGSSQYGSVNSKTFTAGFLFGCRGLDDIGGWTWLYVASVDLISRQ